MVMLKIETGLLEWEKTGRRVYRWTKLVPSSSQCDVIEAFVKPRSRPEPNLGSRVLLLARRPGCLGELGRKFWGLGVLGGM